MNLKESLLEREVDSKQGLKICIVLSFIIALLIFVPFIILDNGCFIFLGDFNVQQIPFYQLAHRCMRSGDIFWNWSTEMGVNFISSYTYYLLTSPFFWLTLPFPNWMVPYLMGPLLILKHTVASIFAYIYVKRFVKDNRYAILGGILYAFSGFIVSNIFFNQFHEAVIFFPLLLIALEELIVNNKKIYFCLAVFVNCFVSYWMFIGQAVFLVIYILCRLTDRKVNINFKKFLNILIEGIIGVLMACVAVYPSLIAIAENTRVGANSLLSGWNLLLYNDAHRIPAILQCLFFPPELPSQPTFFPYHTAKWSSMSAWLPFVGLTGVISYIKTRRKTWIKTIIITSFIMAMFPFLNSIFTLCNFNYYCRWYYMPILMMCLATVIAFENQRINLKAGIHWSALIIALFLLPGLLNLVANKYKFYNDTIIATVSLAVLVFLVFKFRTSKAFPSLVLACTVVVSAVYPFMFIYFGKQLSENISTDNDPKFMMKHIINAGDKVNLPNDDFYRIDTYKDLDNIGMFWNMPNLEGFHSIVPGSLQYFYSEVGVKRMVASRLPASLYELRSLFSSKYLFVREGKATQEQIYDFVPGAVYYDTQNGFDIYENQYFIPFGFCYNNCIGDFVFKTLNYEQRRKALIRYMYLDDKDIEKYQDVLPEEIEVLIDTLNDDNFVFDVEARRTNVVNNFSIDKMGFSSDIDLPEDNLVFFSIPFEKGWSATVNGKPVEIIKANVGFMAIKCNKGHNDIRFNYFTPGLREGAIVSLIGVFGFIIYVILFRKKSSKQEEQTAKNRN